MEAFLKFLVGISLSIGAIFTSGLVLSVLWGWFFVRLGLPALTVPQALGVSLVVSFLTLKPKEDKEQSFVERLLISFLPTDSIYFTDSY